MTSMHAQHLLYQKCLDFFCCCLRDHVPQFLIEIEPKMLKQVHKCSIEIGLKGHHADRRHQSSDMSICLFSRFVSFPFLNEKYIKTFRNFTGCWSQSETQLPLPVSTAAVTVWESRERLRIILCPEELLKPTQLYVKTYPELLISWEISSLDYPK